MASSFDDRLLSAGGEMTMTRGRRVRVVSPVPRIVHASAARQTAPPAPRSARGAVEGRALACRDRDHLAALLGLDAGIGRHRCRVAVPGGWASRAPSA